MLRQARSSLWHIAKIEQAVLEGGLFAMAMPRGSGKTTLCETACLWALLYGHREFVTLIGADEEHAEDMLESIKSELENNDLLEEDFSEVCGPIRALDGIHQRAAGQLYQGARTHIGWTAKEIILPTIDASCASGAVVRVAGITGRIRGMKAKRPDGKAVRPSLVLLDVTDWRSAWVVVPHRPLGRGLAGGSSASRSSTCLSPALTSIISSAWAAGRRTMPVKGSAKSACTVYLPGGRRKMR